jgi:hypothetical protein
MTTLPTTIEHLTPTDRLVVRDALRFGALARHQLVRRYRSLELTDLRLQFLLDTGWIARPQQPFPDTECFVATHRAYLRLHGELRHHRFKIQQLGHDLALVDLADYLERENPIARWFADLEVNPKLDELDGKRDSDVPRHAPDGLLLNANQRIAVELEHSMKSEFRYAEICRWYALETRVTNIWWFTDRPAIEARVRNVNDRHGLGDDPCVAIKSLPDGVFVRQPPRFP